MKLVKTLILLSATFLFVGSAFAGADDLGTVAQNVKNTFSNLAMLITAGSYVAGLGFAIGAILKFKGHKDNPQQVPVGTPIALVFIAAALLFLPSIFKTTGKTLFTDGGEIAGVTGVSDFTGGS